MNGPTTHYTYTNMQDGVTYEFSARAISGNYADGYQRHEWSEAIEVTYRDSVYALTILGDYSKFPASGFVSGYPRAYGDGSCVGEGYDFRVQFENGLVYTQIRCFTCLRSLYERE